MEFEWNDDKAETNFAKHGVSFLEASSVFDDDLSLTFLNRIILLTRNVS